MKNLQSFALFEGRQAKIVDLPEIKKVGRLIMEADKLISTLEAEVKTSKSPKLSDLKKAIHSYKGLVDLQKITLKWLKKSDLSKDPKKARASMTALKDFVDSMERDLNSFKKIQAELISNNEGLLDFIGTIGIKVITFIKNMLTNVKQNMTDTYTDMHRLEDVFDMRGTSGHWYGRWE